MQELAGKTAFVTGAASGIGFALSRTFAETGMKVILADIETDALTAAIERLHVFGPNVRVVICDVTSPASVDDAAEASYEAFGNIHVICNNAGAGGGRWHRPAVKGVGSSIPGRSLWFLVGRGASQRCSTRQRRLAALRGARRILMTKRN